jgi:hypothetical protein
VEARSLQFPSQVKLCLTANHPSMTKMQLLLRGFHFVPGVFLRLLLKIFQVYYYYSDVFNVLIIISLFFPGTTMKYGNTLQLDPKKAEGIVKVGDYIAIRRNKAEQTRFVFVGVIYKSNFTVRKTQYIIFDAFNAKIFQTTRYMMLLSREQGQWIPAVRKVAEGLLNDHLAKLKRERRLVQLQRIDKTNAPGKLFTPNSASVLVKARSSGAEVNSKITPSKEKV